MSRLVLDASVVMKWILQDDPAELDTSQALLVLDSVRDGRTSLIEPVHWLAEVAAVCIRLRPDIAMRAVDLFYAMDIPVRNTLAVYRHACSLATEFEHHVFDTLYHAVALESHDTLLVTTDSRYFRKAERKGAIVLLADFSVT
jgi:predicted nucleic acid-binding protein